MTARQILPLDAVFKAGFRLIKPPLQIPLRLNTPHGIRMVQWLRGYHAVNGVGNKLVKGSASEVIWKDNKLHVEDTTNSNRLEVLFQRGFITGYPFGMFAYYRCRDPHPGNSYGCVALNNGSVPSTTALYYRHHWYKDRVNQTTRFRYAYESELTISLGTSVNPSPTGVDRYVVLSFSLNAASHWSIVYHLNADAYYENETTTSYTPSSFLFDRLQIGGNTLYGNAEGAKAPNDDFYTAGAFSGTGITKSFCKDLLYNPYRYLEAAVGL